MDLLGLDDFRVLAVNERTHDFHFLVTPIAPPLQCVHCNHDKLYRHETKPQLYMDLPIRGKRVGITVERRRYRCCACHRTFFEPLACMNETHFMTNRLVTYIQQEALRRTFVSIADETGLVESTIRVLFSEFAATTHPRFPDNELLYLGIDELYLLHQYRCVITNVANHHIIDLLRDRTKPTVSSYLRSLPESTKERITVVCTDMWASYHDVAREVLPHAKSVVDKWHVLKLLSGCLEAVRKDIRKNLTDQQRRTLMHDRFLLLRRPHDLDEHDTLVLDTWLSNFPRLETAYRLKEAFYSIYEAPTEEEALHQYFAWFAQITPDIASAFYPLTLAIEHYGDAIFAYFTYRYTAGYTESLNGLIQVIWNTSQHSSILGSSPEQLEQKPFTKRRGRMSFNVLRARILFGKELEQKIE